MRRRRNDQDDDGPLVPASPKGASHTKISGNSIWGFVLLGIVIAIMLFVRWALQANEEDKQRYLSVALQTFQTIKGDSTSSETSSLMQSRTQSSRRPSTVSSEGNSRFAWTSALQNPRPFAVLFQDPRAGFALSRVGVIGFHGPSKRPHIVDMMCGSGALSNAFEMEWTEENLHLEPPLGVEVGGPQHAIFGSAETAILALKFWHRADQLKGLAADVAARRVKELGRPTDATCVGYGNEWLASLAVLLAKFDQASCAKALLSTGDAFLVDVRGFGDDSFVPNGEWSKCFTSGDGAAGNQLGMQLMLIRDWISGRGGWTPFIEHLIDVRTGRPHDVELGLLWKSSVRNACEALSEAIAEAMAEEGSKEGSSDGLWNMLGLNFLADRFPVRLWGR